jgi:hypothetical protein
VPYSSQTRWQTASSRGSITGQGMQECRCFWRFGLLGRITREARSLIQYQLRAHSGEVSVPADDVARSSGLAYVGNRRSERLRMLRVRMRPGRFADR